MAAARRLVRATQSLPTSHHLMDKPEDAHPIDGVRAASSSDRYCAYVESASVRKCTATSALFDRPTEATWRVDDFTVDCKSFAGHQGRIGGAAHFTGGATWPNQQANDGAEETTEDNVEYADLGEPPGHRSHLGEQQCNQQCEQGLAGDQTRNGPGRQREEHDERKRHFIHRRICAGQGEDQCGYQSTSDCSEECGNDGSACGRY